MLTTRFVITQNVWHKKLAGNTRAGYCPPTMLTQKSEKMCSLNYSANIYLTCTTRYLLVLQNICGFVMRSTYWSLESRSSL